MAIALIGLGANLGDREAALDRASAQLAALPGSSLLARSSQHATAPAGGPPGQAPFLNAAALVDTFSTPAALLAQLQAIETLLGRTRDQRWGPRAIDLDLLLVDRLEICSPQLTLPHPRLAFRRFALAPAVEIAPELVHPINGWTLRRLLEHLDAAPPRVLLDGADPARLPLVRDLVVPRLPPRGPAWECGLGWLDTPPAPARLLVFLADEPAAAADDAAAERIARADARRRAPDCGPVLWLPQPTLAEAAEEVLAAMAAME